MKDVFETLNSEIDVTNKYLQGIYDDINRLRVILKGIDEDDKKLQITFRSYISFRTANESYRLKTLYESKFKNGLNYSSNSKFIDWIKEESRGIYDDLNMIHYLICSNDDITDVISFDEPVITWLER